MRTFEQFLTRKLRIRTLTPPQLVLVRVAFDGVAPADLPPDDRELAAELLGDVARVPEPARHVLGLLKGARVGGTWLCSLFLLFRGLTADLTGLAAGEVAFGIVVAPDLRLARQALRYVSGAARAAPSIARLIDSETADSVTLKRPDGRLVTIECLPAARGGAATRGRTLFAALLDEAAFFRDPDTGVVNDVEVYRSIAPRVLKGGMVLVISTCWLESGLLWDLVERNHGHPRTALAAIAPTLLMRPDDSRLAQVVAEERERDPDNARREFDCVPFGGGTGSFFDSDACLECVDTSLGIVGAAPSEVTTTLGGDLGLVRDSSALVAVHTSTPDDVAEHRLAEVLEHRPRKGSPLRLSTVIGAWESFARRHGSDVVHVDHHALEPAREHATELSLSPVDGGQAAKVQRFVQARDLIHSDQVRIPGAYRSLALRLTEVVSKPLPGGGTQIILPRRHGTHLDVVAAFVLALSAAHTMGADDEPDLDDIVGDPVRWDLPGRGY